MVLDFSSFSKTGLNDEKLLLCFLFLLQIVMPRIGWRWLLGLSAVPSFILLVFYTMTPESPRYLCLKGNKTSAFRILEQIAKLNGTELPPGVLASDQEIELKQISLPPEGAYLLNIGKEGSSPAPDPPPKWKDSHMGVFKSLLVLISPKLLRSTLLLWIVMFGNAFSYYGLVLLTTELNKGDENCNPTAVHSQKSADIDYRNVFIATLAGKFIRLVFKHVFFVQHSSSMDCKVG